MANLRLSEEDVATERNVILEERRSRVDNDPSSILQEQMMAALYANHPYGIPIIGWSHEIAALDREDALGFYKRFYAPNNALLVIAGDVEPDEVRKLAEETFGKLPPHASLNGRSRPQEPEHYAPVKVELEDARAGRMTVQRYYLTPSYATAAPGEAEALDLLMRIAAAGSVSKLYKRLVIEQKKAASAGGWYSDSGLDDGRVAFYAIGAEKVTPAELESGHGRRHRRVARDRRHPSRARPRPQRLSCRVRLHHRQPVAHGASLWLAACHRHDRRRRGGVAGAAEAGDGRGYPRRGAEISRGEEFGDGDPGAGA